MRKVTGCLITLAFTAALAACGGGGGGSTGGVTPITNPTNPPAPYKVSLKWVDGATSTGTTTASVVRSTMGKTTTIIAHPLDTSNATITPVEIGEATSQNLWDGWQGAVYVNISPQPSASPSINVTITGVDATVSPLPYASPGPTDPPRFSVSNIGTTTPATGSLSAAIGDPVNAAISVPVYVNPYADLNCGNVSGPPNPGWNTWTGISFVNGVAQNAPASSADFYIDGPNCTADGNLNASESTMTLHFPYGAVEESSGLNPFVSLTPAQWTNSVTSLTVADFANALCGTVPITCPNPNAPDDELLLKTSSGKVVKLAVFETGETSGLANPTAFSILFDYDQDGFAQDGF